MAHKRHARDLDTEDDGNAEEKRQRLNLQRVVLEVVRANAIHKFWEALEPMVRRVVSEEVERVIAKYLPALKLGFGVPSIQPHGSEPTSLRLQFQNKLALPLYTGSRIEGASGSPLRVFLQDACTGEAVRMDDKSSMELDVVVLEGDFSNDEKEDWLYEDFENHVVKERDGKRPLLTGDLTVSLKGGVGTLGELVFTDNSSWIRSRKFRLGLRLSSGFYKGVRIREARTEAFLVKDHRGQLYKKHYPPNLADEVWRLEKIGKDGAYHKRLVECDVNTVKDFLVMYATGPSKLREIFGTNMSAKTWDSIIEHAKTCTLNDTQYVYYPNDSQAIGVLFNCIYHPLGIVREGTYVQASALSDTEQVYMERLAQEAYKDLSRLCKLLPRAYNEQIDTINKSGDTRLVPDGRPSHVEVSETPLAPFHSTASGLLMSSGGAATGYEPRILENDAMGSTLGTRPKNSLFTNTWSPGTLESIFVRSNYPQAEADPLDQDMGIYQNNARYLDDYNQGRGLASWGNDELLMLSGISSKSFSNALVPRDDSRYSFSRMLGVPKPVFGVNHLHRKAYMGWLKLKAVLKCSYFMRKGITSKRRVQLEQLN